MFDQRIIVQHLKKARRTVISKNFFPSFILCFFLFGPSLVSADLPEAPVILDAGPGGCIPTDEICGDGVDQDCNGSDVQCPGSDGDRDGYAQGQDCDDTNRKVYPGISVPCSTTCGQGTKTCQADGSFTECSCTPLCEARGNGRCYYVSKLTGNDSNPGTFSQPWKTFLNFVWYYAEQDRPPNWIQLKAGDVVYLMSGLYSETFLHSGERRALYFRNLHGTADAPIVVKAYPGAHPVIAPDVQVFPVYLLQSTYFLIEGLEVVRGWQNGVRFEEGGHHELRNMWVHDIDGVDNNNVAGICFQSTEGVTVHHSVIHDNYDRTNADTGGRRTGNSRNVVLFGGGNNRLHHNVVFQTPDINADKTGSCIAYKHSATIPESTFEVDYNVLWNCAMVSIGGGTFGHRVHHNLIINSEFMEIKDFGGPTHNRDNIIEYNTFVGTSALYYAPTDTWGPIGDLTFRYNIVVDDFSSYGTERGIVTMYPYGSDAIYDQSVTPSKLTFGPNCYFNPSTTPKWSIFAAGGSYGSKGGVWDLGTWQSMGFDTQSNIIDPQLDSNQIPQNAQCQSFGWFAQ